MAGLFDFLRDNPAITQGLLAGGFGAMAGRGSKLQAWGQGGLAGLQGYSNALNSQSQEQDRALAAKRAAIQEQMLQMQLENAQRQQQGQKATQDYLTQALSPVQAIDANAVSGVMGPRPEALKPVGTTPGFNLGSALKAGVPVDALPQIQQMLQPKAADYKVVGDSLVKIGPDGAAPVYTAPQKENLEALIIRGPDGRPMVNPLVLDAKRQIASAGATNVSFGQPVAGVDARGNPVFFQPDRGGGAPAIVPGVKPAPQNRDTKLPAELQRMQIAGDAMSSLLDDYEGMLKKYNPRDPMVQANPTIRAEMQSLKRNLELQFKELQALGALAGPDVEIMRQALSDPFSWSGAFYGSKGLLSQVGQARSLIKKRGDAVMRSQGKPAQETPEYDQSPVLKFNPATGRIE